MKVVLLDSGTYEIIDVDLNNGLKDVLNILGITNLQGYHSFGVGYTALWQEERKEKTSMEITVYAGVSFPIFIDSKVIIINEDEEGNPIDINIDELKKHFNISKSFWALVRNFI